ncbi:hypothetical protein [uncultured Roseibium sp.]|uniref:hypothetical protein n=1 Tax=uncultured Roseibium sp. TaxID=1936171 RepID=UPI00321690B6
MGILAKLVLGAIVIAMTTPVAALDLGKSGVSIDFPARGWKVEDHDDAAMKIWHLRAETWDPIPEESGMIAITVTYLDGDPWPDIAALRDKAAEVISDNMLVDVTEKAPFETGSGRYQIAGADFAGSLDMMAEGKKPVSARLVVIRTGTSSLLVTAFSLRPLTDQPFAALFGPGAILSASGPGASALNTLGATETTPAVSPEAAPPAETVPAADGTSPNVNDLLKDMQQEFSPVPAGSGN